MVASQLGGSSILQPANSQPADEDEQGGTFKFGGSAAGQSENGYRLSSSTCKYIKVQYATSNANSQAIVHKLHLN